MIGTLAAGIKPASQMTEVKSSGLETSYNKLRAVREAVLGSVGEFPKSGNRKAEEAVSCP